MSRRAMAVVIIVAVGLVVGLSLVPVLTNAASGLKITAQTGDGHWHGNTWEVDIYPGEELSTTLTFYNPTRNELEVKLAVEHLSANSLKYDLSDTKFTLSSKKKEKITLSVQTQYDTKPGTYSAELEIKYVVVKEREEEEEESVIEPEPPYIPPEPKPVPIEPTPVPPEPMPAPTEPEQVIRWWWFAVAFSIAAGGTCAVWLVNRKRAKGFTDSE